MAARPILFALIALTLTGCVSTDYGYAYCYDAYRGPVGYNTGPFEPKPACATEPRRAGVFATGQADGYGGGAYVSGPYPMPVAEGAIDASSREAAH